MASLNMCSFIGNISQIETRYLPDGTSVTNLTLAVNDKYKDKSGHVVEHVEWVRCSLFAKLSEIAEKYCNKGDPLFVTGQMRTRKFTDKEGVEKQSTEIRVDKIQLLGSKGGKPGNVQGAQTPAKSAPAGGFDDMDDDIPF